MLGRLPMRDAAPPPTLLHFEVRGTRLAADLHAPARSDASLRPVVVMAHGFGASRSDRLPAIAARFAQAGHYALVFDYRGFGGSEGEPRDLVDPARHLEDYAAAVRFAARLPGVDPKKVVVWGTSFAGGHAIVTAAELGSEVAALVAQVPHVDGFASSFGYPLRLLPAAMRAALADRRAEKRGLARVRIPVVAPGGALAALATADCYAGYTALAHDPGAPVPEVPARILLDVMTYRPITFAARVRAPALILAAAKDTLIPVGRARAAAKRMAHGRYLELPVQHFDVYAGAPFEEVMAAEIGFLRDVFGADAPS